MTATAKSTRRTASRERRRQQLIDSTMKCIARKGIGSTTLGDVASDAGLSQGIVNLHFDSKDNLLTETLRHLSDEYRMRFDAALASAEQPAAQLYALMQLDLHPSVCDWRKVAVWYAFWSEVAARPTYREICAASDEYYDEVLEGLCQQLVADGNYSNVKAENVTMNLMSMTNGMWLACLISAKSFDRNAAMSAIDEYLTNTFPQHYPL